MGSGHARQNAFGSPRTTGGSGERRAVSGLCVQNKYNLAYRVDDALVDVLAQDGVAYVPYFPLGGGFTQLQSSTLSDVAQGLGATPAQIAIAWLLRRSPNILVIAGTSSVVHLRENVTAATIRLPDDTFAALNRMTRRTA